MLLLLYSLQDTTSARPVPYPRKSKKISPQNSSAVEADETSFTEVSEPSPKQTAPVCDTPTLRHFHETANPVLSCLDLPQPESLPLNSNENPFQSTLTGALTLPRVTARQNATLKASIPPKPRPRSHYS